MPHKSDQSIQGDHNDITVETLRTPPLRIQPAPIRKRAAAAVIDSVLIGAVWTPLLLLLHQSIAYQLTTSTEYLAAIAFLYYSIQESLFAWTIGKRLMGLQVVGYEGDPASVGQSLIRNLVRLVDWLPLLYLVGAVTITFSARKQRLGDVVAATVVTLAPKRDINPPPAPFLFH